MKKLFFWVWWWWFILIDVVIELLGLWFGKLDMDWVFFLGFFGFWVSFLILLKVKGWCFKVMKILKWEVWDNY